MGDGGGNATDAGDNKADAGGNAADAAINQPDAPPTSSPCDSDPCFAGVECSNLSDGFDCGDCPAGFEGDGVICTDIDGCAASPCYPGVVCTDQAAPSDSFTCGECPAGFFGNGEICTDIDACAGSPCFPGVACVDNPPPDTGFICGTCPTGYTGDGLSCSDIDACAGDPCFAGVECTDIPAPGTGFTCQDCPAGHLGDGQDCALVCSPVSSIGCGGVTNSATSAAGSTDQVDKWQCSNYTLTGPERVYSYVASATGVLTVELSGLTADLDLLVIRASSTTPGLCDSADSGSCLTGGKSSKAGTGSERVRVDVVAGTTYFIIVDGFNNAVSNFSLRLRTGPEDILLNEIGYGSADFVEVRNHGACPVDLGGLSISHKASLDNMAANFVFPSGTSLSSGNVLRWIESGSAPFTANEINAGISIPDLPYEPGFTALCNGVCNMNTCANFLDYVERDNDTSNSTPTGGPSCAGFKPAPINCAGQSGEASLHRTDFTGTAKSPQADDWSFGVSTRD